MAIYALFYDLFSEYIFGGGLVTGTYEDLITMLCSTIACLLVVALPFIIIWRAIKIFI